jgi:hypothetical protein
VDLVAPGATRSTTTPEIPTTAAETRRVAEVDTLTDRGALDDVPSNQDLSSTERIGQNATWHFGSEHDEVRTDADQEQLGSQETSNGDEVHAGA